MWHTDLLNHDREGVEAARRPRPRSATTQCLAARRRSPSPGCGERVAVWTGCSVDDIFQAPLGKRHDKPRGVGRRVEYGHDVLVIEQTLDTDFALHPFAGVLDVAARSSWQAAGDRRPASTNPAIRRAGQWAGRRFRLAHVIVCAC